MSDGRQEVDSDAAIAALESKLSRLQTRENEVRNLLDFVAEERSAVEAELAQRRAMLNPLSRLPPELLIHIFVHAVEYDDELATTPSAPTMALAISHVCRTWRALALATSALWSCIYVGPPMLAKLFLDRCGQGPINIIGSSVPNVVACPLLSPLLFAMGRWRSIRWTEAGSRSLLEGILHKLNDKLACPMLEKLTLARRSNTPVREATVVTAFRPKSGHLARLHMLELREVVPTVIPPVPLPSLRTMELYYELTPGPLSTFRMSNFLPLVQRSPNLRELVISGIPVLDVSLSLEVASVNTSVFRVRALAGDRVQVPSLKLQHLQEFDWCLAPSRDLWAMFFFISMPSLVRLRLCLDAGDKHWKNADGQLPSPVNLQHPPLVAALPSLQDITVECHDTDSLTSTLKKIRFPSLCKLTMICNVKETVAISQLPQLPRLESIFHEPRLPLLTHLALRSFQLDTDGTLSMLQYMPALTHLTLNACDKAGAMFCRLSGGSCGNGHRNTQRGWVSPRLAHVTLLDCPDVKFSCLAAVVRARRDSRWTPGPSAAPLILKPDTPVRHIRRLKRRPPQKETASAPGTPAGRASLADPPASPNGSFVAGWASHEPVMYACEIAYVRVEGCRRVSQAEAMSLQQDEYGVSTVLWDT